MTMSLSVIVIVAHVAQAFAIVVCIYAAAITRPYVDKISTRAPILTPLPSRPTPHRPSRNRLLIVVCCSKVIAEAPEPFSTPIDWRIYAH